MSCSLLVGSAYSMLRSFVNVLRCFLGLIVLVSIGFASYALISKSELVSQVAALQKIGEEQDESSVAEIESLKTELAKLDKLDVCLMS